MREIDADKFRRYIHEQLELDDFCVPDEILEMIDEQETVNEWIPCSERLPSAEEYQKCNGLFIVSDGNRTYSTYFDIYDSLRFGEPTIERFRIDKRVIAWQPLPESYK